jgi:hypothetical protein
MPHRIGFMREPFPVKEGTKFDSEIFKVKCRGWDVEVEVSQCKLSLDEKVEFSGVISSEVDIAKKLPMHGFGSHCHMEEADAMKEAVQMYAEKRGMGIGGEYNNWPSFRGHLYELPKNPGKD